jgi:hypothetical protein
MDLNPQKARTNETEIHEGDLPRDEAMKVLKNG